MGNIKKEYKTLTDEIIQILYDHPEARDSDKALWYMIICKRGLDGMNIGLLLADDRTPNFDSVSRIRRMVQKTYPELRASNTVEESRAINEEWWHSYGRAKAVAI